MLTRVLIVGRASAAIESLKAYLQGSAGLDIRGHVITNGHVDPLEGIDFTPDIVLLHFEAKRTAELSAWAARPKEGRPILIVVGPGGDGNATRLAIRSGARDFLPEPVGKADLVSTVQQVRAELRARTQGRGAIHVFVGAAGGAGSSFIAANVAHLLAKHARRSTALVDLDLNFSPTAHHLNLTSQRGLLEAIDEVGSLDAEALAGFGALHESGLRLYSSTAQHAVLSKDVQSDRLSAFIGLLSAHNQHVVIDVPHAIDNLTATAFGLATEIYIVLQQSTLHVRNATRVLRILRDELSVAPQRLKVLVNRVAKNPLLQLDDISRALNTEIFAWVPNHYQQALESSDTGVPLYNVDRNAAITASLLSIVGQMTGAKTERPGLLRRVLPSFLRNKGSP
jgi:pilus assembly protein CpaE